MSEQIISGRQPLNVGKGNSYPATEETLQSVLTAVGEGGAILDGVSSAIKATVHDYTNSNPLAVVLRDTNGDYVSVGGGTQYTEDAAAATNPVGTAVNLIRSDTPTAQVSLDGDNVAQRGTNYGAAYVQLITSAGAYIDSVGGGTQYADGAVRGTATGTIAMGDDGTNIQSIHCDTSGDLQVDVLTMPTVAVTGTFYQATQPVSATDLDIRNLTNVDVVTAELSAVDNAVLDTIAANTTVGTVSTVNSTTATLGIGGVFTGTSEDVKGYGSIIIATKSDVASATNGLSIQFSTDGTNWDHIDAHTIPAATSHTLTVAPQARYFRIVYTNGGTGQASFRLQSIFRSTAVGPQMETLSGDVSDTNFALTTRAVLAAKKPNGDYTNIQATAGGNLKVSIEEQDAGAGLATSAKQDALLTELQLKADLTETQPVSLASVPSHAVTNAGTFAVQNNAATPAGTNTIGNVGHGKTLKTKTGSASATFSIVAAVASKKIKVYSLSLITASTTAVTITFKDGAAGTALTTYPLQALTGTNFGLTENVAVPSSLFETSAGTLLEMSFSAAQTVTYNIRYFDDDST